MKIGTWLGHEKPTHLRREGITRVLQYLLDYLLRQGHYVELWCYDFQLSEVKGSFERIINKYDNIRVCSSDDLLVEYANAYSEADLFLVPIITLGNALGLRFKKLVQLHDLFPIYLKDLFCEIYGGSYKDYSKKIENNVKEFIKQGSYFQFLSNDTRQTNFFNFFGDYEKTKVIYTPCLWNIDDIELYNKEETLKKFSIKDKYIFYPTQNRPYKNVIDILRAIRQIDIQLVITGMISDCKEVFEYNRKNKGKIIETGDLNEKWLYSLYKNCDMIVSPSSYEGGLPHVIGEALTMNIPVITNNIEVTIERCREFKSSIYEFLVYPSRDIEILRNKILYCIYNREKVIKDQEGIRTNLLSYTWNTAGKEYEKLIGEIIEN